MVRLTLRDEESKYVVGLNRNPIDNGSPMEFEFMMYDHDLPAHREPLQFDRMRGPKTGEFSGSITSSEGDILRNLELDEHPCLADG